MDSFTWASEPGFQASIPASPSGPTAASTARSTPHPLAGRFLEHGHGLGLVWLQHTRNPVGGSRGSAPPASPLQVNLNTIKRCLLINYNPDSQELDFRH